MSLTIPWCAASGAAPTARGSRGHGLGARCRPSPTRWPSGGPGLVVEQGGGAVRQGSGRREHEIDSLQASVALLRVRDDPHLVVVAILQHDHGDGAGVTLARRRRCACRLRVPRCQAPEVAPLSRAVLLSHAARFSCGGMRRVSVLGCGAARSRTPVLGAGLGSVGSAMSVCTLPRCGTHTPPWASWWVFNHQIHTSTRWSEICVLGLTSAWSCRTKILVVAACGRGPTAKSLFVLTFWRCSRRAANSSLEGVVGWMP